jgi:hypothetical protein
MKSDDVISPYICLKHVSDPRKRRWTLKKIVCTYFNEGVIGKIDQSLQTSGRATVVQFINDIRMVFWV